MDGMPVVGLADYLTKSVYGSCSDAAEPRPHGGGGGGGGDNFCNVQAVFEGLNLKHMEPFVEKGAYGRYQMSTARTTDILP
jgi:hypothetical protein